MEKKAQRNFLWVALLALGTIGILARHNRAVPYQTVSGLIFGTVYNITYQYDSNLKAEIEAELKRFDGSLSPFNDTATITRINRNEEIIPDTFFTNVFRRSMEISRETQGAFDITVAPLANAWGFGFKKGAFPDSAMIDSLLDITGYPKVSLSADGKVIKQDSRIMLSCSAVAKGYAVDVIAQLLEKKGIGNFMVDIGGEVVVRGENPKKSLWRIGINKPIDDSLAVNQELQTILQVTDVGIATHLNQQADRRLALRKSGIADHTASYRCGHSHFGKLPKLLLQRRQKICPYYRPAHRLSGAAQYPVGHSDCPRLHECRCLCHCFHGHGPGRSRTLCRFTPRPRRMLHICG